MSPEKWLKEEASWQLEKIIDALNSAHNMPFHCAWLERDLAMNYLEMLKGMESLLFLIGSQLKISAFQKSSIRLCCGMHDKNAHKKIF